MENVEELKVNVESEGRTKSVEEALLLAECLEKGKDEVMKIVDKTRVKMKEFQELELEDMFRWDGRLFMKTSNYYDDCINAYDFNKHRLTEFTGETEVEFIPSELILHEKGWNEK